MQGLSLVRIRKYPDKSGNIRKFKNGPNLERSGKIRKNPDTTKFKSGQCPDRSGNSEIRNPDTGQAESKQIRKILDNTVASCALPLQLPTPLIQVPTTQNLMPESATQDLPPNEPPVETKAAQKAKNRGKLTTAAKRAAQFEDLEVRGDECWCSCCHVVINVITASKHIATQGHKKRKWEATKVNIKPGVSAAVEGTHTPTPTPVKAKGDTVDAPPAKNRAEKIKSKALMAASRGAALTRPHIRAMGCKGYGV